MLVRWASHRFGIGLKVDGGLLVATNAEEGSVSRVWPSATPVNGPIPISSRVVLAQYGTFRSHIRQSGLITQHVQRLAKLPHMDSPTCFNNLGRFFFSFSLFLSLSVHAFHTCIAITQMVNCSFCPFPLTDGCVQQKPLFPLSRWWPLGSDCSPVHSCNPSTSHCVYFFKL